MNKNLIWKTAAIVIVVLIAALSLYPPQEKLKAGLDLAGGTSLTYEIDISGLEPSEQKDLAQNMVPILLKRIDPTHVANIVMRPQGNTRIEIQIPVASQDTRDKREAYEKSLVALEDENINLLKIRQTLTLAPEERLAAFDGFARGSDQRRQILDKLAGIYDLRKEKQSQRDALSSQMDAVKAKLIQANLSDAQIQSSLASWAGQEPIERNKSIETFVKDNLKEPAVAEGKLSDSQTTAISLINRYVELYSQRAPIVEALAKPVEGLNDQWKAASKDMGKLNLNIDLVREILEMPADSKERSAKLEEFKTAFPTRKEKIDAAAAAYSAYKAVGGQLDDPEDLKRMLKGSGVLEFRILATTDEAGADELTAFRESLTTKGPKAASDSRYIWCQIEDPTTWPTGLGITGTFGEKMYVLCSNQKEKCLLREGEKSWKLKKAYPSSDQQGRRAIGFTFDTVGANKFFRITSDNIGKPLCILLDDQALSAPNIQSAISSSGVITGSFTQTEVTDMINKLNAGSFPARLSDVPISEKSISATIGKDNRDQGIKAGLIGLACVVIFMIVYYFLAGVIANVALLLNVLLVLSIMALLDATFTLPGIAGFILTIGMSVDANVLINERIREEQQRGSSVKAAIANGYHRAFITIFDSNLTTFLPALVLYIAASEEVKGFAIVLMIGQVANLATALFVTRVIFDWLTSSRLLTNRLSMMSLMKNPTINWMGLRPIFLIISAILMIGGLAVFFTRDESRSSKYDIEFIGGTSVEIELKESANYDRKAVDDKINQPEYLNGLAKVYEVGDTGRQFEISTTETNKTTANITLAQGQNATAESVAETIRKKADELAKPLSNLNVTTQPNGTFYVSTSRVNAAIVEEVLTQAFGEKATISNVVVRELVSDAVREAFKDILVVRENLGLKITGESKIQLGSEDAPLLADYLGGIKLSCTLATETTAADLETRISNVRFKPDMQDLTWYNYKLLKDDLTEPANDEKLKRFVYVSVHPDAGYRELEDVEWQRFIENEKRTVTGAASLETTLSRVTQIDPSVGAQAKQRAIIASVLSLIAILAYIWIRFGTARYGFAAIIALIHNVFITLGLFTACTYVAGKPLGNALLLGDFKINLEIIAAFLTLIGYSVNDTIVVFDRIRENRGKLSILTAEMITTSINQTLSRTILTGTSTLMVLVIMYIWGGAGLRGFTFVMLVGVLVGTYSSIAIASPILLIGMKKTPQE